MNFALKISPSSIISLPKVFPCNCNSHKASWIFPERIYGNHPNVSGSLPFSSPRAMPSSVRDVHSRSSLESRFCYDKPIPEEIIEKPIGLSLALKNVGDNPHCPSCQAKGAVLCTTCSGSGLYVESILESQGIIVKVAGELGIQCVRDVGVEVTSVLLDRKVMGKLGILRVRNVGRGHIGLV